MATKTTKKIRIAPGHNLAADPKKPKGKRWDAGDVVECEAKRANRLIKIGAAAAVSESDKA